MYDLEKLSWIIDARRKRFKLWLVLFAAMLIFGIVLFVVGDDDIALYGLIVAVIALALFIDLWRRYAPAVLFSREIRGINIKEHEYVSESARGGYSVRRGLAMRGMKTHSNSGHAKSRRPHVRSAYVYVKLDGGEVAILDGLTSLHTDIYEIGDEILRPEGARYPIILNRDAPKQPCPLCGRINGMDAEACACCGLSIVKE